MNPLDDSPYSYRSDTAVPAFPDTDCLTVMDATCGMCSKGALWIARYDRAKAFRIVPLQSDLGHALLRHYGLDPDDPTSWLYLESGRPYFSADAVIRVAQRLGGRWRLLTALRIIPAALLHRLYLWVARNRYRISGRADLCNMPDPAVRARLLREAGVGRLETDPESDL